MYKEKEETIKGINYEREEKYEITEEKINRHKKVDKKITGSGRRY